MGKALIGTQSKIAEARKKKRAARRQLPRTMFGRRMLSDLEIESWYATVQAIQKAKMRYVIVTCGGRQQRIPAYGAQS